jgi:hypothetical protein
MPDPAKPPPKKNLFQKIADFFKDVAEWVEETFSDPEIAKQVREDLGQNADNPATPTPVDANTKQKIDQFLAKEDVDKAAFAQTVAEIKNLADVIMTFADAVKADGVSAADVFWLIFKVWGAESLRLRNPAAYAVAMLAGLVLEDDELLPQLDPAPLTRMLKGEGTSADADALVDRISAAGGALVVLADQLSTTIGGTIDAMYGWDPEPGTPPEAAAAASRILSTVFRTGEAVDPILTLVPVSASDGGPGLLISNSAHLHIEHDTGSLTYTTDIGANGAFALYFRFSKSNPDFQVLGPGAPSIDIGVKPTQGDQGKPALVCGATDGTRLELGAFSYGVLVSGDAAGFKLHADKGKLVITLADGDGFLNKLPGKEIQVPFNLGLIADTANGVRFDGGSGLKVNLPVAASVFGVFTVQYIALELKLAADPSAEVRGAFSVRLGPFQASVDQIGTAISFAPIRNGLQQNDSLGDLVKFLPPKGIGLALDAGAVKGGGYLFIDAEKGEYAGALELKLLGVFSVKAIALLSTRRPDGSPGWSLLLFIYAQFKVHIAFGIFWTGLGGMIGLHHRSDLDALTAGMKTGALDDILFPANPVADAPRIIDRYRQLFPIEQDTLLFGPMLEFAFSEPPIVYVRIGLIFELKNALGGDKPVELTKVILLGQLLAQLPPRDTGAPAIVKLLVDIVGFYDAPEKFLLIRSRLRDSFVGIEHFAKLDLTGEMVLAMRFGDNASFVLSAGGFHPAFKDIPQGVPVDLERMAVSFGIGAIKIRNETYFAVTSNSVQAGCKFEVAADIDVAAIKGHLSFDALLYLSPRFYFIVELDFQVSLEAFGESLASVTVHMSLEGPGEWHAKGKFSFSILWWDVDIGFDEKWGSAPAVEAERISAIDTVKNELSNRDQLMPGPPLGGSALVTLAQNPSGTVLAHPLSVITVAQKAVPFDVDIDRIGTRRLTEDHARFTIDDVLVGEQSAGGWEPVTDHFARGQFMELSEQQKLDGRSVETFTSGVRVGTTAYRVETVGSTVVADYEVGILEPETGINLHWKVSGRFIETVNFSDAVALSVHGAAATSARAVAQKLVPDVGKAVISEVPLAVADATTLVEHVTVASGPASSEAIAMQTAASRGGIVVEAHEVAHA